MDKPTGRNFAELFNPNFIESKHESVIKPLEPDPKPLLIDRDLGPKLRNPHYIEVRIETPAEPTQPDPRHFFSLVVSQYYMSLYQRDGQLAHAVMGIEAGQRIFPTLHKDLIKLLPEIRAAVPLPANREARTADRDISILQHAFCEQHEWMNKARSEFKKQHPDAPDEFYPYPALTIRLHSFHGHTDALERIARKHKMTVNAVNQVLSSFRGASDDQLEE